MAQVARFSRMSFVTTSGEILAERIRREVYLLTAGDPRRWQGVWSVEKRLGIRYSDMQAALVYAVTAGWIEALGDPIISIRIRPTDITPANKDGPWLHANEN